MIGAAAAALAVLALVLWQIDRSRYQARGAVQGAQSTAAAQFVGVKVCAGCHQGEFKLWTGSHHQLAMQPATDATVLGDFNGAALTYHGVTSRFFRQGGGFFVRTDGTDGALHDYRIQYTFGVAPLQQYLVAMPAGRLQALGIAWDSRPRAAGGQRWFDLYAGQKISAGDSLHWTGADQNWNYMCADCHSTNVRKNYDFRTRGYATTYAEINVACEACHGPGSRHVAWARGRGSWQIAPPNRGLLIALDERRRVRWRIDPATGNARRGAPPASSREIQMCARCHSRRGQIHEDFVHGQPLGDDYRVALLDAGLYYPDGQIKAEDYEYGSFIQSRMFHAGVTCGDCHEPHRLELRAATGTVCFQCHAPAKYDSSAHHFHKIGSPGSRCIECHMPSTPYMVIDARHDHSLRIPRPDLSVTLGVPNACTKCHTDKLAQWAASAVRKWYGHTPIGFQRFAEALDAGSRGAPGAAKLLAEVIGDDGQPAIARASALARLGNQPDPDAAALVRGGVQDTDPLVRRAAAQAMSNAEPKLAAPMLSPLLEDPVRMVRIEAAQVLAGAPADILAGDAAAMSRAAAEYVAAQELNADRPEAHLNLALLFTQERQFGRAETQLREALSLQPSFMPAAVNLADLYRELGREGDGESVLREAIAHDPADASLQHALGLSLIRQGRRKEAVEHLALAAKRDPSDGRIAYAYALALDDAGRSADAIEVLRADIERHPYDRDALAALATVYGKAGQPQQGLIYADRLEQLDPEDAQVAQLIAQLRAQAGQSAPSASPGH
jgi:tetratricopeptide (TPR) repeat protein